MSSANGAPEEAPAEPKASKPRAKTASSSSRAKPLAPLWVSIPIAVLCGVVAVLLQLQEAQDALLKIVFVTTMVALLMSALLSSFGKTAELGGGAAVWAVLFGILYAAQPKVSGTVDIHGRVMVDNRVPDQGATITPIGIKDGVAQQIKGAQFDIPGAFLEQTDVRFVLYVPGQGTAISTAYKRQQLSDLNLNFASEALENLTFLTIDLRTPNQENYGAGANISFLGTDCYAVYERDQRYRMATCNAAMRMPSPNQRHTLVVTIAGKVCDFPLEGPVHARQSVCLTTECQPCPTGDRGTAGVGGSSAAGTATAVEPAGTSGSGRASIGGGDTQPAPATAGTNEPASSAQVTDCTAAEKLYAAYAKNNLAATIGTDGGRYAATLACSMKDAAPKVTSASIDEVANDKLRDLLLKRTCIDACGTFEIRGKY